MPGFTRKRIAILHSQQPSNAYAGGGTGQADSEQAWMRKLAIEVTGELVAAGHDAILSPLAHSYADNVKWVNGAGVDFLISLHSNATGKSEAQAKGTVGIGVYHHPNSARGKALAGSLLPFLKPASAKGKAYISTITVAEVASTNPPALLVENEYHDWVGSPTTGGADWIRDAGNRTKLAKAYRAWVVSLYGEKVATPPVVVVDVPPVVIVPPVVTPPVVASLLLGIANCQSYNGDKSAKAWTARGLLMKAQGRNAWCLCEVSKAGLEILLAVLGKTWRAKVLGGKTVAVLYNSAVASARTARPAGPWAPFGQGSIAVPLWFGEWGVDLIATQTRPGSVATDAQKDHDIAAGAGLVRGWPAVFAGDFNRNDPHLPGWVRVLDGDTLDKPGSQRLDAAFTHGPITARNGKTIDPGPLSDHKWRTVDLTPVTITTN